MDVFVEDDAVPPWLLRPMESAPALALTGGPLGLTVDPASLTFFLETPQGRGPRGVEVEGRVVPGIRVDVSRRKQGTEVVSSHPDVVRSAPTESGTWVLEPGRTGSAVVTVRNRRATTWMGVWVVGARGDEPAPPEEVTEALRIRVGALRPPSPGEGFADTQVLHVRNESSAPVLGPLFLVLRLPPGPPLLVGPRRTAHPGILEAFGGGGRSGGREDPAAGDRGLPVVEILPGLRGPRVPGRFLAPGESVSAEVRVTGPLDLAAPGVEVRVFRAWRLP